MRDTHTCGKSWLPALLVVAGCLSVGCRASQAAEGRAVIMVPMAKDACQEDFTFLAAVPAGTQANTGNPAVLAVDPYATIRPETRDFLRRYKPTDIYLLDCMADRQPTQDGLIAHWPMDDARSGRCRDVAGKHDGVLRQAPIWQAQGKNDYRFDGRTVRVDNGHAPGSARELTVAFWMKPTTSAHHRVINKGDKGNREPGWSILLRNEKEHHAMRFRIGSGGGGWNQSDLKVDDAYAPGEWVHVTCTFADGVSKVYLNGKLKGTRENITWSTPNNLTDPIVIGDAFTGTIDELRIYHRDLNLVEIQNLTSGNATTDGLVGYWPMDAINEGTVRDHLHANHLKVKGKPAEEAGKVNGGLAFKDKADFLQFGNDNLALQAFSVRFDVRSEKRQKGVLLRKTAAADRTPAWSVELDQTDLHFHIGDSSTNRVTAANAVAPGTDCNVVVTCERNTARIYVNGKLAGAGTVKLEGDAARPLVGEVDGIIDHLRLYSRALSQEEIPDQSAPATDMLAHWHLDGKAMQSTARQERWTAGKRKGALLFNGVNDYVICEPPASTSGALTVACWIKAEKAGCLFSRLPYEQAGPGWAVRLQEDKQGLELVLGQDGTTDTKQVRRYPYSFVPDQWSHIALTVTKDHAVLYLDGRKVMRWKIKGKGLQDGPLSLLLGALQPGVESFKGEMDDVYLFDLALTEEQVLALFATPPDLPGHVILPVGTPEQTACMLAKTFWQQSDTVVLCDVVDYRSALAASALAARLKAPLLYGSKRELSEQTRRCLRDLAPKRCVLVGADFPQVAGIASVRLADAVAIVSWMKDQGMAVDYLAAANPQDRTRGEVRKSSLAAPLLAAARNGAVALLDFDTQYKLPMHASPRQALTLPDSVEVEDEGKVGTIDLNGHVAIFTLNAKNTKLNVYGTDGKATGTFETGDRLPLGDRIYTLALDPESGRGKADLWLTWPGVPEIRSALGDYYQAYGRHPQYLCLLGWPDVIPHALIRRTPGQNEDLPSDLPLADTDDDLFVDMAHGRIVGEDLYSTVLTATRALVYEDLSGASWSQRLGIAGWSVQRAGEFKEYGFADPPLHTGKEGPITADSPLCDVAAIMHGAHSWWRGMGGFMECESRALFAPTLIESGGCSTMRLDRDEFARSIPARQLRNGAVCVAGNTRNGIGQQGLYRSEFWNAILRNETVGQAHRDALNRALMAVLEKNENDRGGFRYQFYIRVLYGDPALHIPMPALASEQAAYFEREGDRVIVHGPTQWHCQPHPPSSEWNCKHDQIFTAFAPGIGNEKRWHHQERHDTTDYYYTVELKTDEYIADIKQLQDLPEPLGWSGKFWVDEHQDGTRSIFWRVRIFEVDEYTGQRAEPKGPVTFELNAE